MEDDINDFLAENSNIEVIDIKYQVGVAVYGEEQIFCFSALIFYKS